MGKYTLLGRLSQVPGQCFVYYYYLLILVDSKDVCHTHIHTLTQVILSYILHFKST